MSPEAHCSLCGRSDISSRPLETVLLELPHPYEVVRCCHCGLLRLEPKLTTAEYADYYAQCAFYRPAAYEERASARRVVFEERLGEIERFRRARSGRMLLDLGCAAGHFLASAQARGWQGVGVELSEPLAEHARRVYGLRVIQTIDEAESCRFEVVHANHVLEHLTDPLCTIKSAFRVLVPDGLLAVEVPNQFDSWSGCLKRSWLSLVGDRPGLWPWQRTTNPLHHVYFFSPPSLTAMLEQAGFIIESVSTVNHAYCRSALWTDARRRILRAVDAVAAQVNRGRVIVAFARKPAYRTDE